MFSMCWKGQWKCSTHWYSICILSDFQLFLLTNKVNHLWTFSNLPSLQWEILLQERSGGGGNGGDNCKTGHGRRRRLWHGEVCQVSEDDVGPHREAGHQQSSPGTCTKDIIHLIKSNNFQIISVMSTIFVAVSIVGMTISTLEILQYQVWPIDFDIYSQLNSVQAMFDHCTDFISSHCIVL